MSSREIKFERVELFEQLWAQPVKTLAESYGVSGAEVKRAAAAMEIPMPPSGHWTKVEFGKGIPRPELPETTVEPTYVHRIWVDDEAEEVSRRIAEGRAETASAAAAAVVPAAPPMPAMQTDLADCLPIVKKMAAALKKAHRDTRNWPTVGFMGMFDLSVSPQNQQRALLTFDRVLRHCLAAGFKIRSDESKRDHAVMVVEGMDFSMRIFESGRREERELTKADLAEQKVHPWKFTGRDRFIFHPSNHLKLEVGREGYGNDFTIVDGSELPLAERISDVPAKMRETVLTYKTREQIRAEERERQAELQRAHTRKVEAKREQLEKLKKTEHLADRLERAIRLRNLAVALQAAGTLEGEQGASELAWMHNAADWLDPTIDKHWPVVDDVRDDQRR